MTTSNLSAQQVMTQVKCVINSDIMFDAMTDLQNLQLALGTKAVKGLTDVEQDALASAYIDDKGQFYVPQSWMWNNICSAMGHIKVYKKSGKQFIGDITVLGDSYTLFHANGKPVVLGDHSIDTRTHSVLLPGGQKGKKIKNRVKLSASPAAPLMFSFDIMWSNKDLTPKHLSDMFEAGGSRLGIGSYRPQHMGTFGKYAVTDLNFKGIVGGGQGTNLNGFPASTADQLAPIAKTKKKAQKAQAA